MTAGGGWGCGGGGVGGGVAARVYILYNNIGRPHSPL